MSYGVAAQVAELKKWVGFHEGPNNANPFSLWQGYGTTHLPWCDSFANYCACEKGGFVWHSPYAQFGPKGSGYVPTSIRDAQAMGIWRDRHARARAGWQVMFDWTWDGTADHIESVIADDGTKLVTIGGNTSDAVLYRTRDRRYVVGFVALDEAGQNAPPPVPEKVRMFFNPPLTNVVDALASPKGHWLLRRDGSIYTKTGAYHGGANGKPYFVGHVAARLVLPNQVPPGGKPAHADEKIAGKYVYVIVDSAGNRFCYPGP